VNRAPEYYSEMKTLHWIPKREPLGFAAFHFYAGWLSCCLVDCVNVKALKDINFLK